jgi:hypothetical protein
MSAGYGPKEGKIRPLSVNKLQPYHHFRVVTGLHIFSWGARLREGTSLDSDGKPSLPPRLVP